MTDRANSPLNPPGSPGAAPPRPSVTLPEAQLEQIRRLVAVGRAASVDEYVAASVAERLDRDRSLTELQDLFDRKGQGPSAEHLAWAREVLGVEEGDGEART